MSLCLAGAAGLRGELTKCWLRTRCNALIFVAGARRQDPSEGVNRVARGKVEVDQKDELVILLFDKNPQVLVQFRSIIDYMSLYATS